MDLKQLKKEYSKRKKVIKNRLKDFSKVKGRDIFYELCFCLMTPQSKAKNAHHCELFLRKKDFLNKKRRSRKHQFNGGYAFAGRS